MEASTLQPLPIRRMSLADSVYESLLSAIVSGQIRTGTELTTVTLAEQFGVSRTPVQEALHRLAADGLVTCPTGRRATVAEFKRDDVFEIYQMRQLLEGEAAARAATRIAPEKLAEIRARLTGLEQGTQDQDWCNRALECDLWFHEQLATASTNQRLNDDIRRYRLLVRSFCRMAGSVENLQQAIHEHLLIVAALEQRDPQKARETMSAHIQTRLEAVVGKIFDEASPSQA